VLVAEDNPEFRRSVVRTLRGLGYEVMEAATGEQAVELAARHAGEVHLLLADVVMPGMTGHELAGRLAASRPGLKVLFTSGYPDAAIVQHGWLDPETPFLQKPFSSDDLARQVRRVLDSSASAWATTPTEPLPR
jgi:CheY-like chemotaxis protein